MYLKSMIIVSVVGTLVALAALTALMFWAVRVVSHKIDGIPNTADTPPVPSYNDHDLWLAIKRLESAVAEGIEHVDKKSKRIDGVIAGAQRRLEAEGYHDPGLDAEASALPDFDGAERGAQRLPPVQSDVEEAPNPFQGIPGLLPEGWS